MFSLLTINHFLVWILNLFVLHVSYRLHAFTSRTENAQHETCGIYGTTFDECCPDYKLRWDDCSLRVPCLPGGQESYPQGNHPVQLLYPVNTTLGNLNACATIYCPHCFNELHEFVSS